MDEKPTDQYSDIGGLEKPLGPDTASMDVESVPVGKMDAYMVVLFLYG